MFPYDYSEIVSVRPYPEKRNHLILVNISPTLVIDTSMERSTRVLQHEKQKFDFLKNNHAYLSVFYVMFCI